MKRNQKRRQEKMRPVSRIVHDCRATINCTSDVGDKSGESGIPVAREEIISRRRD